MDANRKQMPSERPSTRRTMDARTSGRAAEVVERVLLASAEVLGEVGYAAFRVEDVAARSGVNKTTIYRRWPTRAQLVAATMRRMKPTADGVRGDSLREEVLAFAKELTRFHDSKFGCGMIRTIQLEQDNPELEPLIRDIRLEATRARIAMVERAIARGELPRGTDASLVSDLIFLPFVTRLLRNGERPDQKYVSAIVDMVVAGAFQVTDAKSTKVGKRTARERR
ncbi:MAG: TetR/AcrR family transcriptional regulator [Polyangiaceae bacterium]|nr:TetR/AcrR family transcriptional regulator [Polyangiaceae bacterium]